MADYSAVEYTKGTDSGSKHNLQNGTTTYQAVRKWTVVASDAATAGSAVTVRRALQAGGVLPREGESHPDNGFIFCTSVKVSQESPIFYQAKADYESVPVPSGGGGGGEPDDPLDVETVVEWSSVSVTAEIDIDADGDAFTNPGTGEVWEGVTRRFTEISAVLSRPFLTFSGPVIRLFCNRVNSAPFLGFPAGEGIIQTISARPATYNQLRYYNVTAEIMFREPYGKDDDGKPLPSRKAWHLVHLLRGRQYLKLVNGVPKVTNLTDDFEDASPSMVRIDKDGFKLSSEKPAEFQTRRLYQEADFSEMGFRV
jgi:hypothetical protein